MNPAMLVFGLVVGLVAGFFAAARRPRPREARAALRPHPAERTAAEPTLDAVIAAVRTAGIAVRITPGGFAIGAGPKQLRVYAGDPARVPLREMELVDTEHDALVFDPTDLGQEVTPAAVHAAAARGAWLRAFLLALRLNQPDLLRHVILSTPPQQVPTAHHKGVVV